ncbi:DUF4124 domain-containing protein [Noviherbaspirillum sp. Root189]|uniref:DUF4124 domain-containing protein n=1 Tax=Noviherbaspirillum sp. Root189 TaxID=1736487 RepID=UPI00070F7973|nr:DUF4124 domain-containing protein [Noviherbaspirillum sp. Root189]KRB91456.1 hypothetical protein ASE07_16500 [Noviherbaspirillum sp. Root189]
MNTLFRHTFVTALICMGFAGAAHAQYVWLDDKGVKQFSDMPPPSSIPASRILKQPGSSTPAAAPAEAVASEAKSQMTTAEKNAEFRKRQTERAEKEKKAAEEAKIASEKARNCERAQEYHRALESGERISRTDKNGERSYLSDEQRAKEVRESRRVLDDCKS